MVKNAVYFVIPLCNRIITDLSMMTEELEAQDISQADCMHELFGLCGEKENKEVSDELSDGGLPALPRCWVSLKRRSGANYAHTSYRSYLVGNDLKETRR